MKSPYVTEVTVGTYNHSKSTDFIVAQGSNNSLETPAGVLCSSALKNNLPYHHYQANSRSTSGVG